MTGMKMSRPWPYSLAVSMKVTYDDISDLRPLHFRIHMRVVGLPSLVPIVPPCG